MVPLVSFYEFGILLCYLGGRQSADIVNWLKKKTGPPAQTLADVDAAKTFIEKEEVVVVGFFKVTFII